MCKRENGDNNYSFFSDLKTVENDVEIMRSIYPYVLIHV